MCVDASSQKENVVSNLRETRRDKMSSWYLGQEEPLSSFFDSNRRSRHLSEVVQVKLRIFLILILNVFALGALTPYVGRVSGRASGL